MTPAYLHGEVPEFLIVALEEMGISEINGDEHNEAILEYHSYTTLGAITDETPWCASFVTYCLEEAGYHSTKSAWAKSYLNYGIDLEEQPVIGCLAIFNRGKNGGHVGFYMGETSEYVFVLGGNQGNSVKMSLYHKKNLIAYRYPVLKEMALVEERA